MEATTQSNRWHIREKGFRRFPGRVSANPAQTEETAGTDQGNLRTESVEDTSRGFVMPLVMHRNIRS